MSQERMAITVCQDVRETAESDSQEARESLEVQVIMVVQDLRESQAMDFPDSQDQLDHPDQQDMVLREIGDQQGTDSQE